MLRRSWQACEGSHSALYVPDNGNMLERSKPSMHT